MSWADIMSRMRRESNKKKLNWACSVCERKFEKRENVRCHVLRNAKCSARKATHIKLEFADPQIPDEMEESLDNDHLELNYEERKEPLDGQRPAAGIKNRTGVRPFPAALICKIAKEGKELARSHGRRETSRLLLKKYPLANLTLSSIDRWVFKLTQEKLDSFITLARQKGLRLRLPGNIKEMSRSRIQRPDLESEVYVRYRYRRDRLKLRISYA